ncbi:hypothetical protein os1_21910 [Comamonadaceae bacterium OS-1]|nr:hypothetical protein os1_21910 [Comamonadaceae bacterium OS-1]
MLHPSDLLAQPRPLHVKSRAIPEVLGQPLLVPVKLEGVEGINSLFTYTLTLQTPEAFMHMGAGGSNLDLAGMVGQEITCSIELDGHGSYVPGLAGHAGSANRGAGVREISALITQARYVGETRHHAVYQFTLSPWLHLATLTTDCKVFQDMTAVDAILAVLQDYPYPVENRLVETYALRDYSVQYNESDYAFITRLMQEHGICYHFGHSQGSHRLVLTDGNGGFERFQPDDPDSAYWQIPCYPLGHKIDREYIHTLASVHALTSGSYATRNYDYTRPRALLDAQASAPRAGAHTDQEVYLWKSHLTSGVGSTTGGGLGSTGSGLGSPSGGIASTHHAQPNAGADPHASQGGEDQGQQFARLRLQALQQHGWRLSGSGHIRGVVAGTTCAVVHHARDGANAEFIVLEAHLLLQNTALNGTDSYSTGSTSSSYSSYSSYSTSLRPPGPDALQTVSDTAIHTARWQVATDFILHPSTEPLRPEATQAKPTIPGPHTALVVGPRTDTAANNLYTDTLGRIKVQFPWDRYGPTNQNASCWIRVASGWAGNQLGLQHVPRIGQEVVVSFEGGDPDLPVCTAQVFNGLNLHPWQLPQQQALTGVRSRELHPGAGNSAGGRSNHLVLDDTAEQIQAQLKSDHQHSQLSLGHITRIEDHQGRKDFRGEGFELRTDGHGAVRAQDGLLITTEARPQAHGHTTALAETRQRLAQGHDQHALQADLAAQHKAQDGDDQAQVAQALQAQNQDMGDAANTNAASTTTTTSSDTNTNTASPSALRAPHLVLASPAGIHSTTTASTHAHSGGHHAITSGGHTSISAGKSLLASVEGAARLFAYKLGIQLVSAAADIELQALSTSIRVLAKMDITQTANTITLTAKEQITVNGGGSFTTWADGSVGSGTQGGYTVHSAGAGFTGPRSMPGPVLNFPRGTLDIKKTAAYPVSI